MKENSSYKEDKLFRDKLEELDFEYNYQDWREIESKLNHTARVARVKKLGYAAAIIGSISILLWNFLPTDTKNQKDTVELSIDKTKSYESYKLTEDKVNTQDLEIETKEAEKKHTEENSPKQVKIEVLASTAKEVTEINQKISHGDLDNAKKEDQILIPEDKEALSIDSIQLIGMPCNGSSITLTAHHSNNSYSGNYSWTVNGKEIDNREKSISHLITSEDNILVEVSMNGQIKFSREIEISKIEKPDFTYIDGQGPYDDFKVNFTSNMENLTHIWRIDNQVIEPHQSEFEFLFKGEGLYDVELFVVSENKCSASIKKPISVTQDFDVLAPNAFTPDGDGLNDDFIPHGFLNRDDLFKMEIFDISGKLVYSTKSTTQPWNGNFNNTGEKLLEGMYIWKVSISNTKNQSNAYAGSVRLIRKN